MAQARTGTLRIIAEAGIWVLGFVASYIVAQYAVVAIAQLLLLAGARWDVQGTVSLLVIRIAVYVGMALLLAGLLILRARRRVTLADFGLTRFVSWKDIGLSIAAVVVYVLCTMGVLYIAVTFFGLHAGQEQDLGISTRLFGGELMAAFLVLVVLTPLLEELLFRGFLYGKLRTVADKVPWWVPAILVSALFGVAHGQWNVGLDVFVMSMVACGLREVTGSIWSGVIVHMIKNMVAFMFTFVFITGIGG